MKKIIELAEKAFDTMVLPGAEVTQEMDDAFAKLEKAIKERRVLEQTPITEEWLKEHGWERNEWVFNALSKTSEVGIKEFATLTLVNCYNKGWYVCDTPIRVNTVARLLDVCELCNVKID